MGDLETTSSSDGHSTGKLRHGSNDTEERVTFSTTLDDVCSFLVATVVVLKCAFKISVLEDLFSAKLEFVFLFLFFFCALQGKKNRTKKEKKRRIRLFFSLINDIF
ncbi:Protein CBG20307 [Caenorhabditis briggsae]|uniref:Protein CBG20307 n=1 Tax=Caenorhabditis briggsae TaxID=6238 RepID=A8XXI4_CAEBR|nr:Protein CBG20307 [Caenorhabditis briggsae]CAP37353.1 Protein CBG20307 [Caenorhabditis briggsae]